jgi:hypothetical protein
MRKSGFGFGKETWFVNLYPIHQPAACHQSLIWIGAAASAERVARHAVLSRPKLMKLIFSFEARSLQTYGLYISLGCNLYL